MTGRPRQFDEAETLEKVMESFWQHGYDGTNFETLVRDTGLSRSSLYGAFGGKDELFEQSLRRYLGCFHDEFLEEFFTDGRSGLRTFLKSWNQPVDPSSRGCLLQKVILANAAAAMPRQTEVVESSLTKIWNAIRRALRGGKPSAGSKPGNKQPGNKQPGSKQSSGKPITDKEKAAMFVAMMFGVAVIARNGRNEDLVEALARGAVKFVDAD